MTSPEHLIQERHEFNVIFIHSKLDEVGLTANEFRILAHLARRANDERKAWPGIDSMASICRMNRDTVIECIKTLERYKMIIVERTPGKRSIYRLTGPSKWDQSEIGNGTTSRNEGTVPVGNEERHQSEIGNVSISTEVDPKKEIQTAASAAPSLPTNPIAARLAACIGRQPTTGWSEKEIKSFKKMAKQVREEDLVAVEVYYKVNRNTPNNICRRDLYTLLNNFPGEVDRAKAWADARSGRTPKQPPKPAQDHDNGSF